MKEMEQGVQIALLVKTFPLLDSSLYSSFFIIFSSRSYESTFKYARALVKIIPVGFPMIPELY